MSYEHFQGLVAENSKSLYYVSTTGKAWRVDKETGKKHPMRATMHNGSLRLPIHEIRNPELKRLVWSVTGRTIDRRTVIVCRDGDESNCDITNLRSITRSECSKKTGPMSRSRPVAVVRDGRRRTFRSVREASKYLFVSYQTLLDYLGGKYDESSVLQTCEKAYYIRRRNGK